MKYKKDDYIRTKDGIIDKVVIDYNGHCNSPNCNCKHVSCKYNYYDEDTIIKSSPNIIDLLKKDDLVVDYNDSIYKVNKIYKDYVFTDKKNEYGQVITLVDYQIKSIVTKEQFSQMEYKL